MMSLILKSMKDIHPGRGSRDRPASESGEEEKNEVT